jgi:GTP-sensing pleiotropic transcriptional regulator CodY
VEKRKKSIAVIDGQGGGIGSLIVKRLRDEFGDTIEILALGTNAAATTAMMNRRIPPATLKSETVIPKRLKTDLPAARNPMLARNPVNVD